MKIIAILLSSLQLLSGTSFGSDAQKVSNTAILKTTLAGLNLDNPDDDARHNAAHGDLRLIGVTDYSCHPPGREGLELASFAETYGLRCLDGTSDVIESKEFGELDKQARDYSVQYNRAIVEFIRQREGSNNSCMDSPVNP
ncbi:MAG TPA: hypothetical protein VFN29_08640 [Chiayiivirga sp.]|nr:hypothetical protein [Chiayiivirga sp.]